ncbi:hypothetical protein [Aeromicrobium duanguangcaii]|uniref:hypothetical protein n=1 Tax=Aeromicrobium duanguangcaii TaxID=2968086 RepID=UPI002017BAF9|nr:hypothetical protein [Aeromicrobium duanguangcaii]MCL3836679.1 hypothetical protein [Aeromicrobium duanguangcaii]
MREFLTSAGSQFEYTSELIGAQRVDDTGGVAVVHLEGDFPGGVADLRYRFTMAGDQITVGHHHLRATHRRQPGAL